MHSEFLNEKFQNVLNFVIDVFCLQQLTYKDILEIKMSLSVFKDKQLVFGFNLDEVVHRNETRSSKVLVILASRIL